MDHSPVRPAVGYYFELEGCKVVVSGDTRRCPSLLSNSKRADVLVLEALCCDFLLMASRTFQQYSCTPTLDKVYLMGLLYSNISQLLFNRLIRKPIIVISRGWTCRFKREL